LVRCERAVVNDPAKLLRTIQAMDRIPFESLARGAVVLQRFGYGLPRADSFPTMTPAQRAISALMKTIRHPHHRHTGLDQYGDGHWFIFERHVTEGTHQWRYEVEVRAHRDGRIVIEDAKVQRLSQDEDEDDGEDEAEEGDGDAHEVLDLSGAATPGEGMVACPCCGRATLGSRAKYEICPVCFWEDDGQDSADAGVARDGPNRVSLLEGRRNYLRIGASCENNLDAVRPPTLEEVQVRRFDADGNEPRP
jgi:hypothetical protein